MTKEKQRPKGKSMPVYTGIMDCKTHVRQEWNAFIRDVTLPEHNNKRSREMTEIKNNETQENEVIPRECETKEDFDRALDKKEGEIRENIEHSRQEKNMAEYRAEKRGPISEEDKAKNAEARDKALEEKRQSFQDAVWQKNEAGDWKKNDISDKDYRENVDGKEKAWSEQIRENKRNELIDEMRPVADKPENPDGSSETDKGVSETQKKQGFSVEELRTIKEKRDGQAQNERGYGRYSDKPVERDDDSRGNEVESLENNENARLKKLWSPVEQNRLFEEQLKKEAPEEKSDSENKHTLKETLAEHSEGSNKNGEEMNPQKTEKISPEVLAGLRQNER